VTLCIAKLGTNPPKDPLNSKFCRDSFGPAGLLRQLKGRIIWHLENPKSAGAGTTEESFKTSSGISPAGHFHKI